MAKLNSVFNVAAFLRRIASLTRLLNERNQEARDLSDLVARVADHSGTIGVASDLLRGLNQRLARAIDLLDSLSPSLDEPALVETLDGVEAVLNDFDWELAAISREELTAQLAALAAADEAAAAERIALRQQLGDMRADVERLSLAVVAGQQLGAPIHSETRRYNLLLSIFRSADQADRNDDPALIREHIAQWTARDIDVDDALSAIKDKITATRVQRSELLLLRAMTSEAWSRYTVLLATPSEPGRPNIKVEEWSVLGEPDRKQVLGTIREITRQIDSGMIRGAALTADDGVESAPEAGAATAEAGAAPADAGATSAAAGASIGPAAELSLGVRDIKLTTQRTDAAGTLTNYAEVEEELRRMGARLYELIIPAQLHAFLGRSNSAITITTNDHELPWELMHTNGAFLCLELPLARMPMGRALPRESGLDEVIAAERRAGGDLLRPRRKQRFLLVYSDPENNLPGARREIELIEEGLTGLSAVDHGVEVEVDKLLSVDTQAFNDILRGGRYDIIHFAGHAAFNDAEPDLSGLLLENKEICFAQKIRRILHGRPLVFLNACESAQTANEEQATPQRITRYLQRPAEGLASAFIYGGASGCIGSLWPVYDVPAAVFAVHFYAKLLEGYNIGEAMLAARRFVKKAHPQSISWATFVLYGDPTFALPPPTIL